MVDSHKYNAEGRAAVFGEPDLVYPVARLLCENGVIPVVCATGSVCPGFCEKLMPEIEKAARPMFVGQYAAQDDADFDLIESLALDFGANVLIGSSDGRRIAEKHELDLIRCGFPIHDRIGGQRIRMLGYDGALSFLDRVTNVLLKNKETRFRGEIYGRYYKGPAKSSARYPESGGQKAKNEEKSLTHPCFSCNAKEYARIHLPVAPRCNIQCNYCCERRLPE